MTAERRKAILFLSITLVIGILIGTMVPGFIGKVNSREGRRGGGEHEEHGHDKEKKEWFIRSIYKAVHPDDEQEKKLEPILKEASRQIEALEEHSNEQLGVIIDSVKIKITPLLTEKQKKKLDEFVSKGEKKWHENKRGRR